MSRFYVILCCVMTLTVLSGGGALGLAIEFGSAGEALSPALERLFDSFTALFTAGVGAIFGLLGGKVN